MRRQESILQRACVRWFRYQYPQYMIYAIPNGGARRRTEAAIMKAEGVTAGMPDLTMRFPGGRVLDVEMKADNGRLSSSQKEAHEKLGGLGFPVAVCRSLEEFIAVVEKYTKESRLV